MAIDTAAPHLAQFSIGRVIKDSFGIYKRNFISFALMAIVFRLVWLLAAPLDHGAPIEFSGQFDWSRSVVRPLVGVVVWGLTQAGIVFGVLQNLRGQRASVADVFRGLPFAVLMIIAGLALELPTVAITLAQILIPGRILAVGLVQFVAGIGGLILYVMWWVCAPAIAIERIGVIASLARSAQLTRGRRWRIFGLMLVVGLIAIVPLFAISALGRLQVADLISTSPSTPFEIAAFALTALIGGLMAILTTVTYYHLRVEKEGLGVEEVARIFE